MKVVIKPMVLPDRVIADLSIIGEDSEVNVYFWQELSLEGQNLNADFKDLLALHYAFNLLKPYLFFHEIEIYLSSGRLFDRILQYFR